MTVLEPITAFHAPLLAHLHERAFTDVWNVPAMTALLAMPGAYGFLANTGNPAGFILCRAAGGEAEILTFLVVPEYRRQGIGEQLLNVALATARKCADAMFLEVAADNSAAYTLYTKAGFQPVGRRPHYYAGTTDALILRIDL